jgi:glyoxylase-like metal-dependent hydrolase (beta-lactamase superfamily II)
MSYFEVTSDVVRVVGDESIEDEINACYIIFDSKIAIIDSGTPKTPGKAILNCIESYGHKAEDVAYILTTHEHYDHFGFHAWLKKKTKAKIVAHKKAAETMQDPRKLSEDHYRLGKSDKFILSFYGSPTDRLQACNVDQTVEDGDTISFGNTDLEVVYTGGHCAGHVFYYDSRRKIVYIGDEALMYPGDSYKYYIDFTGDATRRLKALKGLLNMDFNILCAIHDEAYMKVDGKEMLRMAIDGHTQWNQTILDVLNESGKEMTTDKLAREAEERMGISWGPQMSRLIDHSTVYAHLVSLKKAGKVEGTSEYDKARWKLSAEYILEEFDSEFTT